MNILSINQVSKFYQEKVALDKVSIEIPEGVIYGLLGPNGAGKTSLIRIINQITAPDEGEVLFYNEKLSSKHISQIGYLPEERGLYKKMKVEEQILYFASLKGIDKKNSIQECNAWLAKFDLLKWKNKKIEELSKGMQQKVQFIISIIHKPKLIILDEPFSGFDPINAELLKSEIIRLKEEGNTILFSTHRMDQADEMCDMISLINNSKCILQGNTQDIKKSNKLNRIKVHYSGIHKLDSTLFTSISKKSSSDSSIIELFNCESNNEKVLINLLNNDVEIHKYEQLIPSLNEIFIEYVKK